MCQISKGTSNSTLNKTPTDETDSDSLSESEVVEAGLTVDPNRCGWSSCQAGLTGFYDKMYEYIKNEILQWRSGLTKGKNQES